MITPENFSKYLSEEYRKEVASVLKSLRVNSPNRKTQDEVAKDLHVERQHINRLENGKVNITIQELIYYSLTFNCPAEKILYGDEWEDAFYEIEELDNDDVFLYED